MTAKKKSGNTIPSRPLQNVDSCSDSKEIRQTQDLFSIGILNSLTAHICVLDTDGTIIAINRAWTEFGLDNGGRAEALNEGENYFSACERAVNQDGVEEAAAAVAGIKEVLDGQSGEFEMEYDCHSPDEKRWFLMRVTPLNFLGHKAVVSHINITAEKSAEAELSALHSIIRALGTSISLDSVTQNILEQIEAVTSPDLCLLFLRHGEELKLLGARPHCLYLTGEESQAHRVGQCLCGISVSSGETVFSLDINQDPRCTFQECKAAGITSFAAIPLIRKENVIGTIGVASCAPRDFSDNKRFLEAVAMDVAMVLENSLLLEKANRSALDLEQQLKERKELEEQLVQAQKIEALGRLAAGMAHEINNPLAGILQNNQIIKRRLLDDLVPNHKAANASGVSFTAIGRYLHERGIDQCLHAIEEAGERIANLVLDMLNFSRKDTDHKIPCDVDKLMDKALELAENDYNSASHYDFRKIEIHREYGRSIPRVICSPSQLQQVFFNILKNGAEAMAEKDYRHDAPSFLLKIDCREKDVCISLEDNGPGMSEETKKRIFEPFFTTKPVGEGTGLGLSVSYFIITETLKGIFRVETKEGCWTRFLISLPAEESQTD